MATRLLNFPGARALTLMAAAALGTVALAAADTTEPQGPVFSLTVPAEAVPFVGEKTKHYVPFTAHEAESKTVNGDVAVYTYRLTPKGTYNWRVSMPGKLTNAGKFRMPDEDHAVAVTADDLAGAPGQTDRDPNSNSGYNVADIFLNADHTGVISLQTGATFQLVSLRAWQLVDGVTSNYFIEPDFHYTVIDESGRPASDVAAVDDNGLITAKGKGTAIVLVTYDALNLPGFVGGPLWGALWPENTGVVVVTVDAPESGIKPNMVLNADLNPDMAHRLAGPEIDAEMDVIYYTGSFAEYTFKPEGAASVTVASPVIEANTVSYKGFSDTPVVANADGSYTLRLAEGRNIVKLSDGDKARYQVVRARKCTYTVKNATAEGADIKPGDKVTVTLDGLYHPAHKLAGVYNMSASTLYQDPDGKQVASKGNQYQFASKEAARTLTVTIPEGWDPAESYILTSGAIKVSGWGDPYGGHREITYEVGKNPNFNALQHTAYFGTLPDITLYHGTVIDEPEEGGVVLTFEDADFKGSIDRMVYKTPGMTAANYWTSLIDSRQYNGPLLYPEDFDDETDVVYTWFDDNNTGLTGGLLNSYRDGAFWGGGSVVSNYVATSYEGASFTSQLAAYAPAGGKGGYGNSSNFLVLNGYYDGSAYGMDTRPVMTFAGADGEPLYAYINLGVYGLNAAYLGDGMSPAVKEGDYVDALAEALDEQGNPTGASATFRLVDGTKITSEWTKWDLSALGKCRKIRFNVLSNLHNAYGLSFPGYFLLDNIAVKTPSSAIGSVEMEAPERGEDVIYTIMGQRISRITAPGLYIVNGKKVLVREF